MASTLASPERWLINWAGGNAGGEPVPQVNEVTALNYLSVYSCVSLIAGAIAGLPLVVYQREKKGRREATEHAAHFLLHDEFNPDMSAMIGRECGIAHLLTWGNSYTQIVGRRNGDIAQLRPIAPDIVKPVRKSNKVPIEYEVYDRSTGQLVLTLPAAEVLHVPGLGFDGIVGYSPVRIAKTAIRAGMAQDREAEKFVTRGIRPPGALKMQPGRKFANANDAKTFRDKFNAIHQSADGSQQIIILEDGQEWMKLGIDPVDAQLLESRKFSRSEIAGLYRVPPHMVGEVEKTTSWGKGIEEQSINFVTYTLMNWIKRIEQEYNRKLFPRGSGFYCKHLVDGLLRGDALKRAQSLEVQHRRGIITDNEWRELEDRNPVEGGNVRHFPLNEGRVDEDGDDIPPPVAGTAMSPAPQVEPEKENE